MGHCIYISVDGAIHLRISKNVTYIAIFVSEKWMIKYIFKESTLLIFSMNIYLWNVVKISRLGVTQKKAWRKLWWWDKLDVKNFFGKMKPQILRKSLDNDRGMGFCENVLWTNWKKSFTSFKEIYFWSFSNWTPCMKHAIFLFLSFSAQK